MEPGFSALWYLFSGFCILGKELSAVSIVLLMMGNIFNSVEDAMSLGYGTFLTKWYERK